MKFQITLEINKEMDDKAKEILEGHQYFFYRTKRKILFNIICSRLRKYELTAEESEDERRVFIEENESLAYLTRQKKIVDDFLFLDYEQFKKEKNQDIEGILNDRIMAKMVKKGLSSALKNVTLIQILNNVGILIETKIIYNPAPEIGAGAT